MTLLRLNYRGRLFLYFLLVFTGFTAVVVVFSQRQERSHRQGMMAKTLEAHSYTAELDPTGIQSGSSVLPDSLRITLIDSLGNVVFDRKVNNHTEMGNHLHRPEIAVAAGFRTGFDIRRSETTGDVYFYFARLTSTGDFVRVALPYTHHTAMLLAPDARFLIFVGGLFLVAMLFLWLIARRFGSDLEGLKADLTAEVRARAQLKAEMTSAIAHELRTPTSSIRSYSETLCGGGIEPEMQAQFLERIHSASVRLSDLLEDVSLLTKMEEAPERFHTETVDIPTLAREVVWEFSERLNSNKITVIDNLPPELSIEGSRILVYSIWRNLIENAIKYGGDGGTITLNLDHSERGHHRFSIGDSGSGIAPEHLGRMFERFYRVESGRGRDAGGSGLGLSIVAHAVAHHRGEVFARNCDCGGLEVCFSLNSLTQNTPQPL